MTNSRSTGTSRRVISVSLNDEEFEHLKKIRIAYANKLRPDLKDLLLSMSPAQFIKFIVAYQIKVE